MRIDCRGLVMWVALAGALSGCAGTAPSRYYLLEPLQDVQPGPAARAQAEGPIVGVGPVLVPQHLDRPDIVTRSGPNQLDLAQFDRWAEPLKDNIARVLAENLTVLMPAYRIALYPLSASVETDYQVAVTLHRLDGDAAGRVSLSALWSLYGRNGRELLALRRFDRITQAQPGDLQRLVSAESELVGELSREIAAVLRQAPPARR